MSEHAEGKLVGAGRYELVRELGRGGMGVVWLARDQRLGEEVALKFLPAEMARDKSALEGMRRETLKSRRLSHPNIVRIHDLDETPEEAPFISMEYVPGTNLHELKLESGRRLLEWEFLRPLLGQLCDALEYAHGQKVVHRDLKPANLMLDADGNLKLADLGLAATATEAMSGITRDMGSSGTPAFMSPQQMRSRAPKVSDDIYALGATLYDLLTSKPPFYTGDIYRQVLEAEPTPLDERLADLELENSVPPDVSAMVLACLAKESQQRPASAAAVAHWIGLDTLPSEAPTAFDYVAKGEEVSEGDEEPPGGGKRIGPLVVLPLLMCVAVVVGWILINGNPEGDTPSQGTSSVAPVAIDAAPSVPNVGTNAVGVSRTTDTVAAPLPTLETFAFMGRTTPEAEFDPSFSPPQFSPYPGVPYLRIGCMSPQTNGNLLVSGIFSKANGVTLNGLARLLPDGALDTNFMHRLEPSIVNSVASLPNGKILCALHLITDISNGQPVKSASKLLRLNSDGSEDKSFTVPLGPKARIVGIAVDRRGNAYVAGYAFTSPAGVDMPALLRFNSRGIYDARFKPALPPSYSPKNAPTLLPSGRSMAGTIYWEPGSTARFGVVEWDSIGRTNGIHLLDCANENTFNCRPQPDGKIVVVGSFSRFAGLQRIGVARLNSNGTIDDTFQPPVFPTPCRWMDAHIHADGRILLAGVTTIGSGQISPAVRLNRDGSIDDTFAFEHTTGSAVYAMDVLPDGKLLLAGQFGFFNGKPSSQIVRLMYDAAEK